MNANLKTKTPWVWCVESEDGTMTVRAAGSSYDELREKLGVDGDIPLPDDCDGVCDLFQATAELQQKLERHGLGIDCEFCERNGEIWVDIVHN